MQHVIKTLSHKVLFTYTPDDDKNTNHIARLTVEYAVKQGVNLAVADLRNIDLSYMNLSCLDLSYTDFTGSNLVEAGLSGSNLEEVRNAPLILTGLEFEVIINGFGDMTIGWVTYPIQQWCDFSDEELKYD